MPGNEPECNGNIVISPGKPDAFSFLNFLEFQRYFSDESKVPVLIVGNKADMSAVRQDYILQPEAFCAKHRVRYQRKACGCQLIR